ncbi:MAG: hypothetical protein IKU52_07510, partial [Clostridia bacterium]|nr:hypothetical protein [Clostridia bacterium]
MIKKEKYLAIRWGFLRFVNNIDEKAERFFVKRKKKIFLPCEDVYVISEHPRIVLEKAFPRVIANVYDIEKGGFTCFKEAKDFVSEDDYQAYGTFFSPLMKRAKQKHYIYGKKEYRSPFTYFARNLFHYTASYSLMMLFSGLTGIFSLYFACRNHVNHANIFFSYLERYNVLILNILPVVFICWLLYFITNSTALS